MLEAVRPALRALLQVYSFVEEQFGRFASHFKISLSFTFVAAAQRFWSVGERSIASGQRIGALSPSQRCYYVRPQAMTSLANNTTDQDGASGDHESEVKTPSSEFRLPGGTDRHIACLYVDDGVIQLGCSPPIQDREGVAMIDAAFSNQGGHVEAPSSIPFSSTKSVKEQPCRVLARRLGIRLGSP